MILNEVPNDTFNLPFLGNAIELSGLELRELCIAVLFRVMLCRDMRCSSPASWLQILAATSHQCESGQETTLSWVFSFVNPTW